MVGIINDQKGVLLPKFREEFMTSWSIIAIEPDAQAVQALRRHWDWMLGDQFEPLMFSAIGDVFFRVPAQSVWWLSTATGSLEQIADSKEQFEILLQGSDADEWFLPGLVFALREHGKVLAANECYTFGTFPVFEHGSFSVENMHPMRCAEYFRASGDLHKGIRSLPDGAQAHVVLDV